VCGGTGAPKSWGRAVVCLYVYKRVKGAEIIFALGAEKARTGPNCMNIIIIIINVIIV